jgi:hypothetical protein
VPRRQRQDPARGNEELFRVLEGFPDLAHDDEVDACTKPGTCSSSPTRPPSPSLPPSKAHLAALRKCEWVVYAKRPFGGPAAVLAYL